MIKRYLKTFGTQNLNLINLSLPRISISKLTLIKVTKSCIEWNLKFIWKIHETLRENEICLYLSTNEISTNQWDFKKEKKQLAWKKSMWKVVFSVFKWMLPLLLLPNVAWQGGIGRQIAYNLSFVATRGFRSTHFNSFFFPSLHHFFCKIRIPNQIFQKIFHKNK